MSLTSHNNTCGNAVNIYFTGMLILLMLTGTIKAQQSPTNFLRQLDSATALNRQHYHRGLQSPPAPFKRPDQFSRPSLGGIINLPPGNKPSGLGACLDTSSKISFGKDTAHFYGYVSAKTKDGNLLLAGEYYNYYDSVSSSRGFLIKCDPYGNIIWAKTYDSAAHKTNHYMVYYQVTELMDGSILMAGIAPDNASDNDDIIFTRTDATGNIIWSKDYYSMAWTHGNGSADYFNMVQVEQDPSGGDVYITSPAWGEGIYVIRLNIATGNIPWSNMYRQYTNGYGFQLAGGIAIRANDLVAFSATSVYNTQLLMYRINKATGDTFDTKMLSLTDTPYYKKGFSFFNSIRQLSNGNIALCGELYGYFQYQYDGIDPLYQAGVIELNSNLEVVKGYMFRNNVESNYYNSHVTVHPDGHGIFNMLHVFTGTGYTVDQYFIQFKDGLILKERKRHAINEGYPTENPALQIDNGGEMLIQIVGDSITNNSKVLITKLHLSDTSSECLGQQINLSFTEPVHYGKPDFVFTDTTRRFVIQERYVRTITESSLIIPSPQPACYQIANCDTLTIKASADSICAQVPFIITTRKNKACGSKVQFVYDTAAVQSFIQLTDSTYQISFRKAFKGYITGMLAGCTLHSDSVPVTVLLAPPILTLGPDTTLCPSNTILLNAHTGYASYKWQNGTTDSMFTVTQPGRYYVTVTNACGDTLSDTIVITPHPPIAFDLGPNQQVCARDTISITAPAGFSNYQWSGSNIANNTLQEITAVPAASGWYSVTAEQMPGCIVADSLFVTVQQTPVIRLGADTSLCTGQQLTLNAGPGFTTYQWNTGQQQQQITIIQPGIYSIKASLSGCSSYDTLQLLNLYPLPVVDLGPDVTLCTGRQLQLSPGQPQSVYLWSTGSTSAIISIGQSGTYWLRISSTQGCKGTDTIRVNFVAAPLLALGKDTTLCQGQTLTLNAASPGATTYQWQDGSTAATYTVNSAGIYKVSAGIGECTVADTIAITYAAAPVFTLGQDTFICTGQQLIFTPALNTTAIFLWQDGTTTAAYTVTQPGLYSLTATNSCGSRADSITIDQGTCFIQMPTAFTPNGDGINDVFKLKYPFPVQQFTLSIYNRYGQLIFQTSNPSQGWNGTFKGKLQPQNSFVWTIRYTAINNRTQLLKGMVTLIR